MKKLDQENSSRADAAPYLEAARKLSESAGAKLKPGQEKSFTDALFEQMRADNLLAVAVTEEYGGPGLGLADIARITYEIANQDGSAGLIYAMHMSQVLSIARHGEGEYFDALRRRMVEEQLLVASGTSEKGPGGDILTSICQIEETGNGLLRIAKESPNISYIDHANIILVTAMQQKAKGKPRQALAVAEVDSEKFTPGYDIEFMGMKGIFNRPYSFEATFAPEAIFNQDFSVVARTTMTPTIQILWAALWSGISNHALRKARDFVADQLPQDENVTNITGYELTRLIGKHHMINALISKALRQFDSPASELGFDQAARINRLKVEASDLSVDICQGAMRLIGIRGYATSGPYSVAGPVADIMSSQIMVSNYRLSANTMKIERFVEEAF